jgi:hypothetical protein
MIQQLLGARQIFENLPSLKGRGGKKKERLSLKGCHFFFLLTAAKSCLLKQTKTSAITCTHYSDKQNKRDDSKVREFLPKCCKEDTEFTATSSNRECYHTLSAVEASKFITIACIRNPQRLHRFCRHCALSLSLSPSLRANPYSCSLFRDLESSRQKSSGAYRDLESSRQNSRGPIGTSKVLDRTPGGLSGPRNFSTEIPGVPIETSKAFDWTPRRRIGTSICQVCVSTNKKSPFLCLVITFSFN